MVQSVLLVLGAVHFLDALFDKWGFWNKLSEYGSQSRFRLVYDLTNCKFCIMFHLSVLITIAFGAIWSFSMGLVAVPFVVGGLTRLIRKDDL